MIFVARSKDDSQDDNEEPSHLVTGYILSANGDRGTLHIVDLTYPQSPKMLGECGPLLSPTSTDNKSDSGIFIIFFLNKITVKKKKNSKIVGWCESQKQKIKNLFMS